MHEMNKMQKQIARELNSLTAVAENRIACFCLRGDIKDMDEAEGALTHICELCNAQLALISAIRRQI